MPVPDKYLCTYLVPSAVPKYLGRYVFLGAGTLRHVDDKLIGA